MAEAVKVACGCARFSRTTSYSKRREAAFPTLNREGQSQRVVARHCLVPHGPRLSGVLWCLFSLPF